MIGTMDDERAGVVLAGGYSERFGHREKATVSFQGEPMLQHVVAALAAVTDPVVVNCRAEQRAAFEDALEGLDVRFAVDPEPDLGPVAGLGTALDEVDAPAVAVVACDMPAVDPGFLRYLFDRMGGNEAAVPGLPDGNRQPAQAVYETEPLREAAAQCLATGDGSLQGVVDSLQAAVVPPAEIQQVTSWRSLTDVNSPEDLEQLEAALENA
jgi:molybdopterin-guanine dinucleotide biosynthesis protein A